MYSPAIFLFRNGSDVAWADCSLAPRFLPQFAADLSWPYIWYAPWTYGRLARFFPVGIHRVWRSRNTTPTILPIPPAIRTPPLTSPDLCPFPLSGGPLLTQSAIGVVCCQDHGSSRPTRIRDRHFDTRFSASGQPMWSSSISASPPLAPRQRSRVWLGAIVAAPQEVFPIATRDGLTCSGPCLWPLTILFPPFVVFALLFAGFNCLGCGPSPL